MKTYLAQLALDDLLADLRHARKVGDLGRLAFVAYCEVRRWARDTGEMAIADLAGDLVVSTPFASRQIFLEQIDRLILGLEKVRPSFEAPEISSPSQTLTQPDARGAASA